MVTIRAARLSDWDQIAELSTHLGYGDLDSDHTGQLLAALLASDNDWVFVAEEGDRLRGWIHCFRALRLASAPFYEIGGLVVSPDSRQRGIGRQLVQYGMNQLAGDWRVRCNSQREATHLFYQRLGFYCRKTQHVFEYSLSK